MNYSLLILSALSIVSCASGMSQSTRSNPAYVAIERVCHNCGDKNASKQCGACKVTYYCSAACQKHDWSSHKKQCKNIAPRGPLYVATGDWTVLSEEQSSIFEKAFQAFESGRPCAPLTESEKNAMNTIPAKPVIPASEHLTDLMHKIDAGIKTNISEEEFDQYLK